MKPPAHRALRLGRQLAAIAGILLGLSNIEVLPASVRATLVGGGSLLLTAEHLIAPFTINQGEKTP